MQWQSNVPSFGAVGEGRFREIKKNNSMFIRAMTLRPKTHGWLSEFVAQRSLFRAARAIYLRVKSLIDVHDVHGGGVSVHCTHVKCQIQVVASLKLQSPFPLGGPPPNGPPGGGPNPPPGPLLLMSCKRFICCAERIVRSFSSTCFCNARRSSRWSAVKFN